MITVIIIISLLYSYYVSYIYYYSDNRNNKMLTIMRIWLWKIIVWIDKIILIWIIILILITIVVTIKFKVNLKRLPKGSREVAERLLEDRRMRPRHPHAPAFRQPFGNFSATLPQALRKGAAREGGKLSATFSCVFQYFPSLVVFHRVFLLLFN